MIFIENVKQWVHKPSVKKRLYALVVLIVLIWVIYRFIMVGIENKRFVFNTARTFAEVGIPVNVMTVSQTDGTLRAPVTVRNNRATVSGGRIGVFKPGQKIGDGVITSVASSINLDTGMYTIGTRGVSDGLNYVEYHKTGFFIPSYAVKNDTVFVVDNGVATVRPVTISGADMDTTVITSGLKNGDVIILSNVSDGDKVQIKK